MFFCHPQASNPLYKLPVPTHDVETDFSMYGKPYNGGLHWSVSAGLGRTGPVSKSLEDSGQNTTSSSERCCVGNLWPFFFFLKSLHCLFDCGWRSRKEWIPGFLKKLKQICISGEFVITPGEGTLPTTAIKPPSCVKSGCHVCTVYFL